MKNANKLKIPNLDIEMVAGASTAGSPAEPVLHLPGLVFVVLFIPGSTPR